LRYLDQIQLDTLGWTPPNEWRYRRRRRKLHNKHKGKFPEVIWVRRCDSRRIPTREQPSGPAYPQNILSLHQCWHT